MCEIWVSKGTPPPSLCVRLDFLNQRLRHSVRLDIVSFSLLRLGAGHIFSRRYAKFVFRMEEISDLRRSRSVSFYLVFWVWRLHSYSTCFVARAELKTDRPGTGNGTLYARMRPLIVPMRRHIRNQKKCGNCESKNELLTKRIEGNDTHMNCGYRLGLNKLRCCKSRMGALVLPQTGEYVIGELVNWGESMHIALKTHQ